jgi:spermidine/putrescine transport system permease protein
MTQQAEAAALPARFGARRLRFDRRPWLLLSPTLMLLAVLLVLPLALMTAFSFFEYVDVGVERPAFQLKNWLALGSDRYYHYALWNTAKISVIVTVITVVVGYIPAYVIATTAYRRKWLLMLLLILPFWISFIIRTLSWIHILGTRGVVNTVLLWSGVISEPLKILYTEGAVIMGLVHFLLPFAILNIYVAIEGVDRNLISAARTLGCTPMEAFWEVTFPLSLPGVATAALLCFVIAAGSYVTPLVLGGPDDFLFGNVIYSTVMSELNWPMGSTLSIALTLLLTVFIVIYGRYLGLDRLVKGIT